MGLDMYLYRKTGEEPGVEVGYWRKANQIHNWFVENCQDGEDESLRETEVTRDQLRQLFAACEEVLADHSKAEEVLPTQAGFFFGSTDYDEYYFTDLEDTKAVIKKALDEPEDAKLIYLAWW